MLSRARFSFLVLAALAGLTACGSESSSSASDARSLQTRPKTPPRPIPEGVTTVRGAGSTFIYPALRLWSREFYQAAEVEFVFDPVASDAGLEQLLEGVVTFAATDRPLEEPELEQVGWVQWPVISGGIVPVVNLLLEPGELVLDGPALADIYLGKIKRWNAARLRELNAGIHLPDSPITVVRRGDASGTTYNFTDYLAKVSPEWRDQVGLSTEVEWPVGIPALGNAGVAEFVRSIPNSIGYVNYAYVQETGLVFTKMINRAGKTITPTMESFRAATTNADYTHAPAFGLLLTDQPGEDSWPIVATTYVVMRRAPDDPRHTEAALAFFDWCYRNGAQSVEQPLYVGVPEKVWQLVEERWGTQIRVAGKPLWNADQAASRPAGSL